MHSTALLQPSQNLWYTAFVNALKRVCDFTGMSHILSAYTAENGFPSPDGEHSCSCIMGIVLLLFHLASSEQEVLDQSGNSFQHSLLFIVQSIQLKIVLPFVCWQSNMNAGLNGYIA